MFIIQVTEPTTSRDVECIKLFLFRLIKREFGFDFIPEYHYDIVNLEKHYLKPERNTFLCASLGGKLVGTLGLRAYDREFSGLSYDSGKTAGLWRVFVREDCRRMGIASDLVKIAENYALKMGYTKIYLHTHKNVEGALDFWISNGYRITMDTNNRLGTVHMEKCLCEKLMRVKMDSKEHVLL